MKKFDLVSHSDRAYYYILEYARVEREGNVVVYKKEKENIIYSYNIPIVNTYFILLGTGVSITTAALSLLSASGVLVCVTGNNGSILKTNDEMFNFTVLSGSNEYRPTEYMQKIAKIFFDEDKKLEVAKKMLFLRLKNFDDIIKKIDELEDFNIYYEDMLFINKFKDEINEAKNINSLLLSEARYVKKLYKYFSDNFGINDFKRNKNDEEKNNDKKNKINKSLTNFNYLLYSTASVSLYSLGISNAFAFLHGKTRRGGLVFDIADLVKDSISIPFAFLLNSDKYKNLQDSEKKVILMDFTHKIKLIKMLINQIKYLSNL